MQDRVHRSVLAFPYHPEDFLGLESALSPLPVFPQGLQDVLLALHGIQLSLDEDRCLACALTPAHRQGLVKAFGVSLEALHDALAPHFLTPVTPGCSAVE